MGPKKKVLLTFTVLALIVIVAAMLYTSNQVIPNLKGLEYTPLARQALIEGDVKFNVKDGKVKLIHGHALLAPGAEENIKTWALPKRGVTIVTYRFGLIGATRNEEGCKNIGPTPVPKEPWFEKTDQGIRVYVQGLTACLETAS